MCIRDRLDSLDIAVSYGTTATANAYQDNRPFRIGNDTGDAYVSNGYYGEIFSFSRILTTSEKSQIKNYLQSKWV